MTNEELLKLIKTFDNLHLCLDEIPDPYFNTILFDIQKILKLRYLIASHQLNGMKIIDQVKFVIDRIPEISYRDLTLYLQIDAPKLYRIFKTLNWYPPDKSKGINWEEVYNYKMQYNPSKKELSRKFGVSISTLRWGIARYKKKMGIKMEQEERAKLEWE